MVREIEEIKEFILKNSKVDLTITKEDNGKSLLVNYNNEILHIIVKENNCYKINFKKIGVDSEIYRFDNIRQVKNYFKNYNF